MDYKGYNCKLCSVYKTEQGKKLYALEILEGDTCVFKSDWVYEGEKPAFKAAKKLIRKRTWETNRWGEKTASFHPEVIEARQKARREKTDADKEADYAKAEQVSKFTHKTIIVTLIMIFLCHIVGCFGFKSAYKLTGEPVTAGLLIILHVFGIIMAMLHLFFGVFFEEFEIREQYNRRPIDKWRRILWEINRDWNLRIEEERREARYYNRPYDDSKKKGWHSSYAIIYLFLQSLFGGFLVAGCIYEKSFGLAFYGLVIAFGLWLVNYILCIMWEISDFVMEGKGFPYRRVLVPFFCIMAIIAVVVVYLWSMEKM